MDYPLENWRKFGRLVYVNRTKMGYADTKEWSAAVGRSSRVLLGLERGEPVGRGTLVKIAEALRWESDDPWKLLSNPESWEQPESSRLKDEEAGQAPVVWLHLAVPPAELAKYEELELISELARRAKAARVSRRPAESLDEASSESGDAQIHQMRDPVRELERMDREARADVVPPVPDDVAARKEGGPSAGERARATQDHDAEQGEDR